MDLKCMEDSKEKVTQWVSSQLAPCSPLATMRPREQGTMPEDRGTLTA